MARGGRGFRVDIEDLQGLGIDLARLEPPAIKNAIRESLRGEGGEALASEMRNRAPRRSGMLRSGIGVHSAITGGGYARHQIVTGEDVLVGYLGASAGGAVENAREQRGAWVESGTKPHTIEPRDPNGSLWINGRAVKSVHHPGQRGQRVALKAMRSAEWEVLADVVDVLNTKFPGGRGVG